MRTRLSASILPILSILFPAVASLGSAAPVRLDVTADTSIAAYQSETTLNLGGSPRIRLKGIQHLMLMRFDLARVAGMTVSRATLHARSASERLWLRTVGLSTVATDWQEGDGRGQEAPRAVCFQSAAFPDGLWAGPQSDFTDVTFGVGNTLAAYTDIREVGDGWLEVDVPPELVQALICGDSYGLVLSDEKGQTTANNDVFSREQSGSAPYLTVEAARIDTQPPDPPSGLAVVAAPEFAHLHSGALRLTFQAPKDGGPTGQAFTYEGELVTPGGPAQPLPRWTIPHASRPGEAQEITLADLPPDAMCRLRLRAVDGAGNRSEWMRAEGKTSAALAEVMAEAVPPPRRYGGLADDWLSAWLCSPAVKVSPLNSMVLEDGKGLYEAPLEPMSLLNRRPSPHDRIGAELVAARNDFVSLQVIVEGPAHSASVSLTPFRSRAEPVLTQPQVEVLREWYVQDGKQWYPEVAVPCPAPVAIPAPDNAVPEQTCQGFWVDLYVPRDALPGRSEAEVAIEVDGKRLRLPVSLQVAPAVLPDDLTFNLDLNGYGTVGGDFGVDDDSPEYRAIEREYHRMAHRHRATLDLLGYSQSGRIYANYAPPITGHGEQLRITDWSGWDEQFGPYLSGEAFAECPRAGVPVHNLYLWLHENWPEPIAEHYAAPAVSAEFPLMIAEHAMLAKPIEEAFDAEYAASFRAAARQIAEHLAERGWTRTEFQCYLNDKNSFKDPQQGGHGTSWWLLDEPNYRDDWLALEYFGRLFKEGLEKWDGGSFRQSPRNGALSETPSVPFFRFREDISRPQWQRDWLRGIVDLMVVSEELFNKNRRCLAIQGDYGSRFWHYGEANRIADSNLAAVLWPLRAYLAGADGIVPWNTVGSDGDYREPDPTAILYPGKRFGIQGPVASLRLKALREGAELVELLALLAQKRNWNREQTAKAVALILGRQLPDDETALEPWKAVEGLTVEDVERLRVGVLGELGR